MEFIAKSKDMFTVEIDRFLISVLGVMGSQENGVERGRNSALHNVGDKDPSFIYLPMSSPI